MSSAAPLKPKPYRLSFEIHDLPKTPNSLLGAPWQVRAGHAKKWERAIWKCVRPFKPPSPLVHAALTLIRCSSGTLDYAGLVGSFKAVEDALVKNGIILDDSPAVIGVPKYLHEPAAPKAGKIKVIVIERIDTNKEKE